MPEIKGGRGVIIARLSRPSRSRSRSRLYLPRLTIPRGLDIPRANYASKQARKQKQCYYSTARYGTVISLLCSTATSILRAWDWGWGWGST
jgi:hypothetical protein